MQYQYMTRNVPVVSRRHGYMWETVQDRAIVTMGR